MKKLSTFTIGLIFLLGFSVGFKCHAQNLENGTITVNTDLVTIWTQVTNRGDASPIRGLKINDFRLREHGNPQQISLVLESQPLSVVILVDGMSCVRPSDIQFQRSLDALRQLGEDAEMALMAWDSDVRLVQPMTRNQKLIAEQLEDRVSFFNFLNSSQIGTEEKVRPERSFARPGEAVYQAARYLEKSASHERRKIIIVISSTSSTIYMAKTHFHKSTEVNELLGKSGITVYALLENDGTKEVFGLSDKLNPIAIPKVMNDTQLRRAGGTLEVFVEQTGGQIYISKNKPWIRLSSLQANKAFGEEFDELFTQLTRLIRSSYTIGYYPENTNFDGKFRRIKLELSKSAKTKYGNVDIKTREGYYAARPVLTPVSEKSK